MHSGVLPLPRRCCFPAGDRWTQWCASSHPQHTQVGGRAGRLIDLVGGVAWLCSVCTACCCWPLTAPSCPSLRAPGCRGDWRRQDFCAPSCRRDPHVSSGGLTAVLYAMACAVVAISSLAAAVCVFPRYLALLRRHRRPRSVPQPYCRDGHCRRSHGGRHAGGWVNGWVMGMPLSVSPAVAAGLPAPLPVLLCIWP